MTEPMTDPTPDVPTLRRLLAEATPGPWAWDSWNATSDHRAVACVISYDRHDIASLDGANVPPDERSDAAWDAARIDAAEKDAALIVAAVNALPGILDRLEAAEGTVARVESLADELAHPDTDLIVAFERAIHRNIARDLRAALAEVTP